MEKTIHQKLKDIENEKNVHILYACECGSRAWGFESQDSDYDVCFIYIGDLSRYLRVENKRDVIELTTDSNIDICGWDLKKALRLLNKSNPSLFEWLNSPITYVRYDEFFNEIKKISDSYYSPKNLFYHYYYMAKRHYEDYLKKDNIRLKKYIYGIRSILSAYWIVSIKTPPTMKFSKLIDNIIGNENLKQTILELVERKKQGFENDYSPRIEILNNYIESSLEDLHNNIESGYISTQVPEKKGIEPLNIFFRKMLSKYNPINRNARS